MKLQWDQNCWGRNLIYVTFSNYCLRQTVFGTWKLIRMRLACSFACLQTLDICAKRNKTLTLANAVCRRTRWFIQARTLRGVIESLRSIWIINIFLFAWKFQPSVKNCEYRAFDRKLWSNYCRVVESHGNNQLGDVWLTFRVCFLSYVQLARLGLPFTVARPGLHDHLEPVGAVGLCDFRRAPAVKRPQSMLEKVFESNASWTRLKVLLNPLNTVFVTFCLY